MGIIKTIAGPNLYYLFDYDQFDMLIFVLYADGLVLKVSKKTLSHGARRNWQVELT